MSENYVTSDGFKPLVLPLTGEELVVGRQYVLTPLARLIIAEEFGVKGLPTVVECLKCRVAATRITTIIENLETGEKIERVRNVEAQTETFRAYLGATNKPVFTVDIKKLEKLADFYDQSHKLPGDINKHTSERLGQMEDEWFKVTSQQSNNKFRGQPLRWWARGNSGELPAEKSAKSAPTAKKRQVDLSILNLA